jgi:hypothetical protein
MVCGVNGSTAPGASSGKLGTEVADAADETEGLWVALPWGNAVKRRMVPSSSTHSMVMTKPVRWVWTRKWMRWRARSCG